MSSLRFNYLFAALLGASFVTAFVIPSKYTTRGFGQLQGVFSPVSRPIRALLGGISRHYRQEPIHDDLSPQKPRDESAVFAQNHELLAAYASLELKFNQLSQLNADRQSVGDIRRLCKPAGVTGSETSGLREVLSITAPVSTDGLANRPVIRGNPSQSPMSCDLIGRVAPSGRLGAQVRLVTDPGFVLSVRFARYVPAEEGKLHLKFVESLHPLIRGIGHNQMSIASNLSMKEVLSAGIAVNDLVLLDDPEWPPNIQGFSIGRIVSLNHQSKSALFADIRVEPATNLMRLTEVMVMIKD